MNWGTDDERFALALDPARRRALGCYFTPWPLARLMARWLLRDAPTLNLVLDPAVGSGRLLRAVADEVASRPIPLQGLDLEPTLVAAANHALGHPVCQVGNALSLLDLGHRQHTLGVSAVDRVIANPPYVREKGHQPLFDSLVEGLPQWVDKRRARQDLQQLFMLLILEILSAGGEAVLLVNSYWMTNDSGQLLRESLRSTTDLLTLVDFGELRLFADAPGQHGLLLHVRKRDLLTPRSDDTLALRVEGRWPDVSAVVEALELARAGQSVAGIAQSRGSPLVGGQRARWYLHTRESPALDRLERHATRLGAHFETHQGIVSGADSVTVAHLQAALGRDWRLGEGIFVLSAGELESLALDLVDRTLVRPIYRARHIARDAIGPAEPAYLLYLHRALQIDGHPAIERHLGRFRDVLERRREVRSGAIPWYALHWPRNPQLFERPRVVTPRRSLTPRFAWAPPGHLEQSDIALLTHPDDDVAFLTSLLVLLNSGPLATWFTQRGKHKGKIREYFGRALEDVPLPATLVTNPIGWLALGALRGGDPQCVDSAVWQLYEAGQ